MEGAPICGDDGVTLDIRFFGFGFLADAVEGGFVFLFLEGAGHCAGNLMEREEENDSNPRVPNSIL